MERALGKTQKAVLRALLEHGDGYWPEWPEAWVWKNRSTTMRVLDSLVARGLVDKTTAAHNWVQYRVNNRGRSLAFLVGARNWQKVGEPR